MTFTTSACAILAAAGLAHAAGARLDPVSPVLLPDGAQAKNPLAHLGGNGPWTEGTIFSYIQ
jgi:hypothetical protein